MPSVARMMYLGFESARLPKCASAPSMAFQVGVVPLGPVASMGQRVLQPIVNQQVTHVLSALEKQVQEAQAS